MTWRTDLLFREEDPALDEVERELRGLDPQGTRWASVFRHTYDVIYNGHETGRYRWDQLMKTEKTHFGTLFEIFAQREFEFAGGEATDYFIAGHQVDAKWSQKLHEWMLPPEVFEQLALVATADDQRSTWSLGLVRVSEDARREKSNRDKKTQLNAWGRTQIHWLWLEAPLRPNILLQLPSAAVSQLMHLKSGTARVTELFRLAEGQIVNRNAVATVARQLDPQKRVRGNGGARDVLRDEGYLVLSGTYHKQIADSLGLPELLRDEYISVRVTPNASPTGALLDGKYWRRATAAETITTPAPILPKKGNQA
jgi:hypothetical protein